MIIITKSKCNNLFHGGINVYIPRINYYTIIFMYLNLKYDKKIFTTDLSVLQVFKNPIIVNIIKRISKDVYIK